MSKLLGYRNATSKAGKPYTMLFIEHDLSQLDLQAGYVGAKVESVFAPIDQVGQFNPSMIGAEVKLSYTVNYGKAYLDQVEVL